MGECHARAVEQVASLRIHGEADRLVGPGRRTALDLDRDVPCPFGGDVQQRQAAELFHHGHGAGQNARVVRAQRLGTDTQRHPAARGTALHRNADGGAGG